MGEQDLVAAFERWGPSVFGVAWRVTRSREAAEEICQDVFLRLWGRAGFDPARGSLGGWLRMLAHSGAVDWVRREVAADERARRAAMPLDWSMTPEQCGLASEDGRIVRAALGRLPMAQRESICLAYFGGLTHTEVAVATGVPLGTAKSRVRDGMLRLAVLLRELDCPTSPIG